MADIQRLSVRILDNLSAGSELLDIAPGGGQLLVQMARSSQVHVTGLVSSRSAIEAGRRHAEKEGVRIAWQKGSAANMPFPDGSFDFIICRAPFRSFDDPVVVLREMRRVLRPGRRGLIIDARRDVGIAQVAKYVGSLKLSPPARLLTLLRHVLIRHRQAYTLREFEALLDQVPFRGVRVDGTPLGVEIWFQR